MHQLGGVEELFAAVDDVPFAVQADVPHQRHERVEDLRHAAAEGGGRDVHHASALPAARPARGFRRSGRGRRCACSRRASCSRRRPAEARGGTISDEVARSGGSKADLRPRISRPRAATVPRGRRRARGLWFAADAQRPHLSRGVRAFPARARGRRLLTRSPSGPPAVEPGAGCLPGILHARAPERPGGRRSRSGGRGATRTGAWPSWWRKTSKPSGGPPGAASPSTCTTSTPRRSTASRPSPTSWRCVRAPPPRPRS